jgi:hypothetical protein
MPPLKSFHLILSDEKQENKLHICDYNEFLCNIIDFSIHLPFLPVKQFCIMSDFKMDDKNGNLQINFVAVQ